MDVFAFDAFRLISAWRSDLLYIFGGLPSVGKTELSKYLSQHIDAFYIRIDTIEQAMKNKGIQDLFDEGYKVAFDLASDNLNLGHSVVADSTNPVNASRQAWREIAIKNKSAYQEIEVICSNANEHKRRVETRISDIDNLLLPGWQDVVEREYHDWTSERLVIDTAGKSLPESKKELICLLGFL